MNEPDPDVQEYKFDPEEFVFYRSCRQRIFSSCARLEKSSLFDSFRELRRSPYCLWAIYIISFLDALAYYAFSYALIMHLGLEVGLPDSLAGLFYGIFGVCISAASIVLGFVADSIGIRASICLSAAVGFLARLAMAYAVLGQSVSLSAVALFIFIAPSIALMGPAIPTAIKRYTTPKSSQLAYTIYYGILNVAAFIATPIVDILRLGAQKDVLLLPPYALLIAVTGIAQLPVFFVAAFWVKNIKFNEDWSIVPFVSKSAELPIRQRVTDVLSQPNFRRVLVTVCCLVGVKSSFRYFDALYLPYVTRAFQDADTYPYLTLLAINPIIVIFGTLTGAITILTNRMSPVMAMIVGSFIGGMAPFWMGLGPYMWALIMYIIWTSVGEIIWSPVTLPYLAKLTKDGDEGAWMALGGLPNFMAKMLSGVLTGGLLTTFCPDPHAICPIHEPKTRNTVVPVSCIYVNGTSLPILPPPPHLGGTPGRCNAMGVWFIIGLTTITSFFALVALRSYIELPLTEEPLVREEEEEEIELNET